MGRGGAAAVAALVLAASGCGGGADQGATATAVPSPSTSASSPSESVPDAAGPTEPSEPAEPPVEPATGPELEVNGFHVRAPKRWVVNNDSPFGDTAFGPVDEGREGGILLATIAEDQVSLASAMRTSWQPHPRPPGFEEQPSAVLAGLTAFYYTADNGKHLTEHVLGNWDSGYTVELNISLPDAMPAQRQRAIVDSILATYQSPRTAG